MRKPLAFAGAFLVALGAAVAVAVAVCTNAGPQPPGAAAPAAATAAAASTVTPTPTPTATATPTPTATAAATATAPPSPKRYDRLDATGAVATAGSWAFRGADGGVLTTWEGLRGSVATLRIHQNDASGASQATAWGEVEAGDVIEWRKSGDCWVRYRVTAAPVRPASGSSRWEFPAKWSAYAATGAGCTGAVGASTGFRTDGDAPSVIRPSDVAAPVRHGPFLLHPPDWTGALEAPVPLPGAAAGGAQAADASFYTTDIAVARGHPLWREPTLPAGWRFGSAGAGGGGLPRQRVRGDLRQRARLLRRHDLRVPHQALAEPSTGDRQRGGHPRGAHDRRTLGRGGVRSAQTPAVHLDGRGGFRRGGRNHVRRQGP